MTTTTVTLDSLTRRIAAEAGISWHELPDFPGFSKGRWRDDVRWLIGHVIPYATVVGGRRQWNGKVGEELIMNLSDGDVRRVIETGRDQLRHNPS